MISFACVANLVGPSGLEPPTSRLSGARSNLLSYEPSWFSSAALLSIDLRPGGDDGNRTHDPLLAGQVLSQLSYTPIPLRDGFFFFNRSLKIEQQQIPYIPNLAFVFLVLSLLRLQDTFFEPVLRSP